MPIFEYRCRQCESEFEYLVMSAGQNIICPECTSSDLKKLFSLFAVQGGNDQSSPASSCQSCSGKHCSSCH